MNCSEIDTNTIEGRLVMAALSIAVNKNKDEVLQSIMQVQEQMFKDCPLTTENQQVDKTFEDELETLINIYGKETDSNTPDFILVKFIEGCLNSFAEAVKRRDKFFNYKTNNPL